MSVFSPTSPSPGQGWVWNVAYGRWDPPASQPQAPPPPPPAAPISGGAGATNQASGLSNGPQAPAAGSSSPSPLVGYNGTPATIDPFTASGWTAGDKAAADEASRDPAGVDADRARQGRDQIIREYNAAAPRETPQASAPGAIPVAQTTATSIGGPTLATAAPVAPAATAAVPIVGPATKVAPVAPISAGRVAAAQIGYTPGIHNAAADAAEVRAAVIDKADQTAFRDDQRDLTAQLRDAAAGKVPSAAELQLQRANSQSLADQVSLAAASHGYGGLAAQQQAGRNVARLQSQNALDAGLLRAKEQETARGQLAGVVGQGREQDIGLATKQGEFQQQANTVGAQMLTDVSKTNAALATDVNKTAAQLATDKAIEQARLEQGAATTSESLALDAAKSNQTVNLQTGLTDAQAENRFRELQAQLNAQGGQFNAGQENELSKLRAQLETATSQFNAGQTNDLTKLGAQLDTQVNLENTKATNTAFLQNADEKTKTSLANLTAQLQSRELDDKQKQSLLDGWLRANGQVLAMDAAWNAIDHQGDWKPSDFVALANGIIGGASNAAAGPGGGGK